MRVVKIVGIAVAVLVVLVGVAIAGVVVFGDRIVASQLQKRGSISLGREIRIGGNFHIAWGRPTRIVAEDIHVANADWGTGPEMFSAKRLELVIEPWPLLHFKMVVPRLAMEEPKILLETAADGRKNWDFFAAKAATPQKRTQFPDLHELDVQRGTFTWHNGGTDATTEITFDTLGIEAPDPQSPIDIAASGAFQHQPYRLDASVGSLQQLQDSKQPYPVRLAGEIGGNKFGIDGAIAEPMDAEGIDVRAELEGKNLQDLMTVFGIPVPETPPYRLAGQVTHRNDRWAVEKLQGRLGKSRLAGGVAVEVGGKIPYIQANLTSDYMELGDFKGFYGGEPQSKSKAKPPQKKEAEKQARADGDRVIPDTQLPVEKLAGLNADIALDAVQIKPEAGLPFERVNLVLALKDGTLHLKPLRFAIAGGEVAAEIVWASAARPPNFDANLDVRRLDLKKLFAGTDVPKPVKELAGIVGGFTKLNSKGRSAREILANANGDIGFFMEKGEFSHLFLELIHLNVLETLNWWAKGDKPLPVNCLVSRFDVKEGIATATTLLLDTPDALVVGAGNVNLGDETLFLELRPHHKSPVAISFRTPIQIRGTLGKPDVHLEPGPLAARIAGMVALGVLAPPAAILPLINTGLGEQNACATAFSAQNPPQEATGSGSSTPPQR